MTDRVKVLKELVGESLYAVDQYAVANAIVLRASVRQTVPEAFGARSPARYGRLSRRRHGVPRSFRLAG